MENSISQIKKIIPNGLIGTDIILESDIKLTLATTFFYEYYMSMIESSIDTSYPLSFYFESNQDTKLIQDVLYCDTFTPFSVDNENKTLFFINTSTKFSYKSATEESKRNIEASIHSKEYLIIEYDIEFNIKFANFGQSLDRRVEPFCLKETELLLSKNVPNIDILKKILNKINEFASPKSECSEGTIPFDYIDKGCEDRADKMREIVGSFVDNQNEGELRKFGSGYNCEKIISKGLLTVKDENRCVQWYYHIALIFTIGNEKYIIDPTFSKYFLTQDTWLDRQIDCGGNVNRNPTIVPAHFYNDLLISCNFKETNKQLLAYCKMRTTKKIYFSLINKLIMTPQTYETKLQNEKDELNDLLNSLKIQDTSVPKSIPITGRIIYESILSGTIMLCESDLPIVIPNNIIITKQKTASGRDVLFLDESCINKNYTLTFFQDSSQPHQSRVLVGDNVTGACEGKLSIHNMIV